MTQTCNQRMRVKMSGLGDPDARAQIEALLSMVEGILSAKGNPHTGRMLIQYDDRFLRAWQISALCGRLDRSNKDIRRAATYVMSAQKVAVALPLLTIAGTLLRRVIFGRSNAADSLIAFELSTAVSVASGYTPVRRRIHLLGQRLHVSDDALLTAAALFVAALRESYIVLAALFLLNFSGYVRRHHTLSAAAKAGEAIVRIDQENVEPLALTAISDRLSKTALFSALTYAVVTRHPLRAQGLLIALNPRILLLCSRYLFNIAERVTHENCLMIPMYTGMDLYEMTQAKTIVCAWNSEDDLAAYARLCHFADTRNLRVSCNATISRVKLLETVTRDATIHTIVLLKKEDEPLEMHQRHGTHLFLQGTPDQFIETYILAEHTATRITWITWMGPLLNGVQLAQFFFGVPLTRLNRTNDYATFFLLAACDHAMKAVQPPPHFGKKEHRSDELRL
ncbi:hypothetical protein [Ferroacidibacillus organovorans]|uniref:Uncharacterized protein n=1 Tax=Ferroacidibacillus organovorans TaxID=1765683 RepID=A0A853KCN8_9BACL|nr:hypothetical protein [Ferroacidibacillus organovorans]KYP81838.1 hypothetical protein AYJ22_05620 [Ferroacidibacillus organovorans]OAG94201.1 hypothetical protein AYW79_06745 [Ferroacidibacillus organovorans]